VTDRATLPVQRLDGLRAEQVAALYANAVPGTIGSILAAAILCAMLHYLGAVSALLALSFVAVIGILSLGRLVLVFTYRRSKIAPADWRRWAQRASISALVSGLSWGFGSLLLMDPQHADHQFIVLLVCAGLAAGSITAFATYLPAYYCSLYAIMVPTTVWAALQHDVLHVTYAVLAAMWTIVIGMLAKNYGATLANALRLQFENLDLANGLRLQKENAEQANIAKTRFLASASHDLRQPVHALGMLVGALRGCRMDDGGRRLVQLIDDSIGSLDSLFTALLDISRLDAGVVTPRLQSFPIQPLLEKICRDEATAAAAKDVHIRLVPCAQIVKSDPVLLERIMRNLISNAVRYTDNGRVLVGCRRSGKRLSIEVWDSGRGISAHEQKHIFQEFYQTENPERDRSKGLGLGLAIVRRLADMLDTPLTLRSRLGKGSVFKLVVVLSDEKPSMETRAGDAPPITPHPSFILVIDDEAAIRESMNSLLAGWGHRVVVAGSCDEMLDHAAGFSRVPDLIISDYRLRERENGVDTVLRLRSEFNEDIPAILITGDTEPRRIREASESDCLLMHKPVPHSKLRAAVTNLIIARQNGEAAG
jgi:signal transduction histidine kinase/CheY-like chemotaxis protein